MPAGKPKKKTRPAPQAPQKTAAEKLRGDFSAVMGLFVPAIFVVQPLLVAPQGYGNIGSVKMWCFVALFCAMLFFMLGFAVLFWADGKPGARPKMPGAKAFFAGVRPYEYAAAAFVLLLGLSTVFSADSKVSLLGASNRNEGLLMYCAYVLTAVLVGRFYRLRQRDMLIFCAVAALVSVYGMCQYYGFDFLGLYPASTDFSTYGSLAWFFSTMANKNVASTYLTLAFCVSAVMFVQARKRAHALYLPLCLVVFYALLLCNTESGYLGLLATFGLGFALLIKSRRCLSRFFMLLAGGLAALFVYSRLYVHGENVVAAGTGEGGLPLYRRTPILDVPSPLAPLEGWLIAAALVAAGIAAALWFLPLRGLPQKIWRRAWPVALAVLAVAAVALLPTLAGATNNTTLHEMSQVLQGNMEDSFGTNRGFIWNRTVSLFTGKSLLVGHGPDTFELLFNQHFYEESVANFGEYFDKAHNEYLQLLFEAGLPALLAYLSFFALVLWRARKWAQHPMVLALGLGVVCFLVQAFFNFSTPIAHPIVWVLVGMLASGKPELLPAEEAA